MELQTLEQSSTEELNNVKDEVLQSQSTNAAIQRLQARVLQSANHSEVITSYDRMHHRHSRS